MGDVDIKSDLLFAVINLIEISSHATGSYMADKNEKWFFVKKEIDELRKKYMKEIVKEEENQLWCTSKHLLSAYMRLVEVGDKYLRDNMDEKAKECYEDSQKLLEIFYNLNFQEPPKKTFIEKVLGKK